MIDESILNLVTQIPNLAFALICVGFMWRIITEQGKRIDRLVEVIVTRVNCDEPTVSAD